MTRPTRAPLARAEAFAREAGHLIGDNCPPGYGFALCITSFGEAGDGFFTHISNCQRPDLIKLLAEWREKLIAAPATPAGVAGPGELTSDVEALRAELESMAQRLLTAVSPYVPASKVDFSFFLTAKDPEGTCVHGSTLNRAGVVDVVERWHRENAKGRIFK
jgi:hypothetical protein